MGTTTFERRPRLFIAAGAVALVVVGLGPVARVPAEFAPYSLITVLPGFAVAGVFGEQWLFLGAGLGALVVPGMFLWAAAGVVETRNPLPLSSIVTFVVLATLSAIDAVSGWETTVRYTSMARAVALVTQAVVPPALLALGALALRRTLTVERSLVLHWLSCIWLAWSAFPWYGELL